MQFSTILYESIEMDQTMKAIATKIHYQHEKWIK